jgi:hypothetical protein
MLTYSDVCCRNSEEAGAHITFQSIPLKMHPTSGSSASDSGNDFGKRVLRRMTGSYTVTPALVPTRLAPTTLVPSQTVTATAPHTPPTPNTPHTPNQSTVRFELHVHLRFPPHPPSAQVPPPTSSLVLSFSLSLSFFGWLHTASRCRCLCKEHWQGLSSTALLPDSRPILSHGSPPDLTQPDSRTLSASSKRDS